jgi:hypothetical protein
LDDEIFIKGFQKLAVDNQFNISIQFLSRHKNFFLPKKIGTWRDNSDFFEEKKEEKIESYIYPIEEIYERGNIMNCLSNNKIVINSSHNLLTTRYLEQIKKLGLPFVISPCSDIATKVDFKWKNATLSDLRLETIVALVRHYNRVDYSEKEQQPLDEEKNIQFICDNYHDVAKFKEIINETDEKIKG